MHQIYCDVFFEIDGYRLPPQRFEVPQHILGNTLAIIRHQNDLQSLELRRQVEEYKIQLQKRQKPSLFRRLFKSFYGVEF